VRGPDLQPIAAGIAALLLAASAAWWGLSAPPVSEPGQPTWQGADIVRLTAAVPQIGRFDHFYVNDDNPFVPFGARQDEARKHQELRNPRERTRPPQPPAIPPPRAPVVVVEPEKPKLVLPRLAAAPSNAPTVYGLVSVDGTEMLIVRMAGAKDSIQLAPGKQADGWTLVSIDSGNLATFIDPQGAQQQFTIGRSDLVAQEDGKPAGAPGGAPATKDPRALMPKPPPQGGPARQPAAQNGEGFIPRPPPREERRRRERPPEAPVPAPQQPKK
jgi:hypothetical protein